VYADKWEDEEEIDELLNSDEPLSQFMCSTLLQIQDRIQSTSLVTMVRFMMVVNDRTLLAEFHRKEKIDDLFQNDLGDSIGEYLRNMRDSVGVLQ